MFAKLSAAASIFFTPFLTVVYNAEQFLNLLKNRTMPKNKLQFILQSSLYYKKLIRFSKSLVIIESS